MKNALIYGGVIGVLSILWLLVMQGMGYSHVKDNNLSPFEYISVLIPLIGLYLGVRSYRAAQGGQLSFLNALMESFRILIVGGVISVFAGIIYISYVSSINTVSDFSGRIFGALLVGVLLALGVSLLLMTNTNKID